MSSAGEPGSEPYIRNIFVFVEAESRTAPTLVKVSKSWNFKGSSSVPKGFRPGALSKYCFRAWLSKISCLEKEVRKPVLVAGIDN